MVSCIKHLCTEVKSREEVAMTQLPENFTKMNLHRQKPEAELAALHKKVVNDLLLNKTKHGVHFGCAYPTLTALPCAWLYPQSLVAGMALVGHLMYEPER